MTGCGHDCCKIRDNAYHSHLDPPASCPRCARADPDGGESRLLGGIVADVLARVAPEIPGLPDGAELADLVAAQALATYADALTDPEIVALDERERRTILASRVGLALAFSADRHGDPRSVLLIPRPIPGNGRDDRSVSS